jgi:hypothetical protein
VFVVAATATHQLADCRKPACGRPRLGGRPLLDGGHDGDVISGNKTSIEHVFDYATGL